MDVLIDLIIYLIKQMSKPRQPGAAAPSPQELARRAALARQAKSVSRTTEPRRSQRGLPTQMGARIPPTTWTQTAAIKPAKLVRPMAAPPAAQGGGPVAPLTRPPATRSPLASGLRLPFLLGQVLEPPVALREDDADRSLGDRR